MLTSLEVGGTLIVTVPSVFPAVVAAALGEEGGDFGEVGEGGDRGEVVEEGGIEQVPWPFTCCPAGQCLPSIGGTRHSPSSHLQFTVFH